VSTKPGQLQRRLELGSVRGGAGPARSGGCGSAGQRSGGV